MIHGSQSVCGSISIHALREEGDAIRPGIVEVQIISIHALREEGDTGPQGETGPRGISIHALREEGDGPGPCWGNAA